MLNSDPRAAPVKRLDALRPFETIGKRRGRRAGLRHVEHLIVELQRVDAGARLDRQLADLDYRRLLIVHHEAFGDDHHRLRQIDGLQRGEQGAEVVDRLSLSATPLSAMVCAADFGARLAQLLFERDRAVAAGAPHSRTEHPLQGEAVALPDGHRLGDGDVEVERHSA